MMMRTDSSSRSFLSPRYLCIVPAVALALGVASTAEAAPSYTVENTGQPTTLSGDTVNDFNVLTIKSGGVLKVLAKGSGPATGMLHIRANRIIIESDGVIDATGSGNPGKAATAGDGPGGGGIYSAGSNAGGGGSYFGKGGNGTNPSCLGPFGLGGATYGSASMLELGSAGGGGTTMAGTGAAGGNGGGAIWLEAATIQINGQIHADGASGNVLSEIGGGGGSGGYVRIDAFSIEWLAKAQVTARGGAGGVGMTGIGGSGGGGIVTIHSTSLPPAGVVDVSGGPAAPSCMTGAGAAGLEDLVDMNISCPDLDADGEPSKLCGGNDCDDTNQKVAPGLTETCNQVDDNCDGQIDEGQTDCAQGLICQAGQCVSEVTPDAGTNDGGTTPAAPDTVEYRGGCTLAPATQGGAALGGLAAAAALTLLLGRRSRRRSR